MLEFLARCDAVDVVINEVPPRSPPAVVGRLIVREADFLGEIVDYAAKTVHVQKIINRIGELWALRDSWTSRQHVGLIASLLWVSSPLRVDVAEKYHAMSFLRAQGRRLHFQPELWDFTIAVPPEAMAEVHAWVDVALRNEPTAVPEAPTEPDLTLFTDASAWGWGAASFNGSDVKLVQYPWGDSLDGRDHSTVAEPEAIWRALCRFVDPRKRCTVRVASDHSAFLAAWKRGFSPAAGYNGVIVRIKRRFPLMTLVPTHIAGVSNPVDALSRGPASPQDLDRARHGVLGRGGVSSA